MDLRSVDLNLLVVFETMAEHGSVTRTAEAIGLSQPATSAALARLRKLLGDPLFVKVGSEMRPTPRAKALIEPVRRILTAVKEEILPRGDFDPATTARSFTVLTPDIGEINLIPKLYARLVKDAPGVCLKSMSMPRNATTEALESGMADLALGYYPDLQKANFFQQRLFRNKYVIVLRDEHPTIGSSLTMAEFLAADHVIVRPDGRAHLFEQFLLAEGIQRKVKLEVSHFMALLPSISSTDLIATVPRDLADVMRQYGKIRSLPTPMDSPIIDLHQFWHRRFHHDPAHIWLRKIVSDLFGPP
ncbi:LysR family transcriptional regulator [Robbsia sp. KACC 23696]|uniref:LysR family transcriptional regulator n=1 Tax=Robbsia sp. KACC 23696 TaxID=3149231 RepID=UPI00325C1535